jgi:hypothetical protein
MFKSLKTYWEQHPLTVILGIAIILRLISVIFAKGFGMHDDHFLVIEPPHSWAYGHDYSNYLPDAAGHNQPTGHSFFYNSIQYLLFLFLKTLRIEDPQVQMLFIRLVHASFSLITVVLGFRITKKLYTDKTARLVGLLLAAYWFMPWQSVRNLVEVVCIPFLLMATWLTLNADGKKHRFLQYLLAGFLFGLAFSIRFQTFFFAFGTGLALLIFKKWREGFLLGAGTLTGIILTQGGIDFFIWGYPFAEMTEYIRYNIHSARDYIIGPWYNYFLVIVGLLLPPVSLFLFWGFFRKIKQHLLLFLPALLFLFFHSFFPNKQERFILPLIPYFIILGTIGWTDFVARSKFWSQQKKLLKGCWIFFWVINLLLLPVVSTMYSKKARVESMTYLSRYKDITFVLFDDTYRPDVKIPPTFYYGQPLNVYSLCEGHPYDSLKAQLTIYGAERYPRFVLFFDDKDLEKRVEAIKALLPDITYETTIKPGFVDYVLYKANPNNMNQTIYIYRNKDFFPDKILKKRKGFR